MADYRDDDEEEYLEEEGQDEYEKDDFIVDEEDDEPEEESQVKAKKLKKRKKRAWVETAYELAEDDYDLLQEANVTGFHRPPKPDGKPKKFKRLKKAAAGISGEKKSGGTIGLSDAEEELKRSLFGEDEDGGLAAEPDVVEEEEDLDEDEEDEMADFIVEVDEHGEPSKHNRKRKLVKRKDEFRQQAQTGIINSQAMQEFQEIFGDVTPLLEERRLRLETMDNTTQAAGIDPPPQQKLLEKQFESRRGCDLRRANHSRSRVRVQPDPPNIFLQKDEQDKARKRKESEEIKKKAAFKPRMIVHPYFQNVSVDDAIKALAQKDVGDFIIRPSSKGPIHLSMTLKIQKGVFTHIDIAEGGKKSLGLTSCLSLGKTLTIGGESYEDLDEVIARYVEPLVGYLREMLRYRKYKQGTKMEIDDSLRVERAANPKRVPYCFSVAHEHHGPAFMLSYIRAVNPHHEYLPLSSKGFRYRKHNFDNIDKLVAYFQKHFNDPILEARAWESTTNSDMAADPWTNVPSFGSGWDSLPVTKLRVY